MATDNLRSKSMELQDKSEEELNHLKSTLPIDPWLLEWRPLYLYQGFWCPNLESTIAFQSHFEAQPTDIFLTGFRKTGTTWLKALIFSLFDRAKHPLSESPLLDHNPHELVLQLESNIYAKSKCPDLKTYTSPRIFGTHLPFASLPCSIKESSCKIVYICRNPLDTFISSLFFYSRNDEGPGLVTPEMMREYMEKFIEGKFPFGPFEDHVLGYWKARMVNPGKVYFVKYEDLRADPKGQLRLLAEFLGCPFSEEEEEREVVDGIVELCSINKLKEAEVNKTGRVFHHIENKWFFRKGEVGDWVNYLTPSMAEGLGKKIEDKLAGSGFRFK